MVAAARWFCASAPYRLLAGRVLLPWALQGLRPAGDALEIGAGSGAMAAQLLARYPGLMLMVTDYDAGMVSRVPRPGCWQGGAAAVRCSPGSAGGA
jgi:hypothetical protein